MPIMQCKLPSGADGFKWGHQGHCYPDRKDAEKQAAAAHANGFVGDCFAIDRATVRHRDVDGRLHISLTNISKANVCPYYGREIPFADQFGLDPDKIYYLLRDPDELAKAAPTSNNMQLLSLHTPVNPTDPKKEVTVGSTGTDAVFAPPYLMNSLVVWDAEAIQGIEDNTQRELSCSYRYVPDMTPGVFEGTHFDGRMTEIAFNHVALVRKGRAGPDVTVGDSFPVELQTMKLGQKVAVKSALSAHLRAMLAADSVPQVNAITRGDLTIARVVEDTIKVFPKIDADALTRSLTLAHDEADDLPDEPEGTDKAKDAKVAKDKKEREEREKAEDERKKADDAKRARDKETEKEREEREEREKAEDERKRGEDSRRASDAINEAVAKAQLQFAADQAAKETAQQLVKPLVGELSGMKSAEEVYRFALDSAGVENKGVHTSALPALVAMQIKLKEQKPVTATTVAMDSEQVSTFDAMFPNRLKVGE